MSPESLVLGLVWSNCLHSFLSLAIGFAVAGALANGYQLMTEKQASFSLLGEGARSQALAAVPFVVFVGPFIIMRSTVRVRRADAGNFGLAMLATVVAGFWSLMSGTFVVMVLEKAGALAA
ncbi:unnamed protein product [Phaeothamnion confervicola]